MSTCSNCSNPILKTTSTTSQTLATGNPIPLQNNIFQSGCGISHIAGSTAISLTRTGTYLVAVTATAMLVLATHFQSRLTIMELPFQVQLQV